MNSNQLDQSIVARVLAKLNLNSEIKNNEESLKLLYSAWCQGIPFDNFWKRLQLSGKSFSEKDQMNPNHFFEIWLDHGVGGTCWTSTKAMGALLNHLGFNVRFITGSMGDMGMPNHGSLIVTFENGKEFIIDTSILNNHPIDISGQGIKDSVHPVQLVNDEKKTMLVFEHVTKREIMPCSINLDGISEDEISEHYGVSVQMSLFNDCVYIRKNTIEGVLSIVGNTFSNKLSKTIEKKELTKKEISEVLINTMGFSKEIVTHIENTELYDVPDESMLLNLTRN